MVLIEILSIGSDLIRDLKKMSMRAMLMWGQVKNMVQKIHTLWGMVTTLEFIRIVLRSQQRHLSIRIIQLTYPIRRSLWLWSGEEVFGM